MKNAALGLGLVFLLGSPAAAFAATSSCSAQGYTVLYVNGILGNKNKSQEDLKQLKNYFGSDVFNNQPVDFEVGYNPSEVGGVDDVLKSFRQLQQGSSVSFNEDSDVDSILANMHQTVKTQKILLVGHSQGSFYTNEIYKYLIDNGVPPSSIGVYNLAVPADYVAGGGKYLTSTNDTVIKSIRQNVITTPELYGTREPLPANTTIDLQPSDDTGHLFVASYLNGAPDRIVGDVEAGLSKLTTTPMPGITDGCFNPIDSSLIHNTAVAVKDYGASTGEGTYVIGVGTVTGTIAAVQSGYAATLAVLTAAKNTLVGAVQFVGDSLSLATHPPTPTQATTKTTTIVDQLYGSSLNGLSAEDRKELLGTSQGSAAVLAVTPTKTTAPTKTPQPTQPGVVLGASIAVPPTPTPKSIFPSSSNGPVVGGGAGGSSAPTSEVVVAAPDVPAPPPPPTPFDASTTPPSVTIDACTHSLSNTFCLIPTTATTIVWSNVPNAVSYAVTVNGATVATTQSTSTVVTLTDQSNNTVSVSATDSAGTALTSNSQSVYAYERPVVINEIEWAGDMFRDGREWIELKNRTPFTIDLSSLAIYAEDGGTQNIALTGTIAPHVAGNVFAGFFVVERLDTAPLSPDFAQVSPFDQLADSGEQLALAQVTGTATTTLDETPPISACNGWCAGSARADQSETLSMERVSADASGTDPSNWASNDTYTVTPNMPTPRDQPWLANGLPLYATPLQENSLHLPRFGFYCNPDVYPLTPGGSYHPQTGQCTVIDRDIPYPGPLSAGVFKGVVGSSTQVGTLLGYPNSGKISPITVDFSDALPGDQYFVAIWRPAFGGDRCTMENDDARLPSYFTTGHWYERDGWCGSFNVDTTTPPNKQYEFVGFTYEAN